VADRLIDMMQERGTEATRKICENLLRGSAMPKRKRRGRGRGAKTGGRGRAGEPDKDTGDAPAGNPVLRLAELEQALERTAKR
jgi:hypothetical protein